MRAPRMTALRLRVPLGAGRLLFMRDRLLVTPLRVIAVGILARVRRLGWLRLFLRGLQLSLYSIGTVLE